MAYMKQSRQTPWIFKVFSWHPSFLMPIFSSARDDAGFSGESLRKCGGG
jgi:hypothetical protein